MKKKVIVPILCLFAVLGWAQKPVFSQAKLERARVYYNNAELMHTASVKLPKGTSEVVISNVADYLNQNTIQVGATGKVTVMSVQFSNRFIEEYDSVVDSPLIKPVRDSIVLIEKEIKKVNNRLLTEQKAIELLDANQKVGSTQGTNVTELAKLLEFYQTKRNQLANEVDKLAEQQVNLNVKLENLRSRLAFNTNRTTDKVSKGKVILQVMNEAEANVSFQIKYLTDSANWRPFYELRVDKINSPVKVLYKADVKQSTGIDWRNVNLELTSGSANQSNVIPKWNLWFLDYSALNTFGSSNTQPNYRMSKMSVSDSKSVNKEIAYEESTISDYVAVNESQLNVSFDISIPYTVLSNGKSHSVSLNDFSIPATYKYYTAPKLDLNAYLVASIKDYGKYNLLAGEANVVFDGVYVGKTFLDPANEEEELKLNMGRDAKITVTRTMLKDKSGTKLLSSRRVQNFEYDIVVRNSKAESIDIEVTDQYPLSSNTDIEIEVTDKNGATLNDEKGLAKWDLKLKANESKTLRFGYQIKSNKDKLLGL